MNRLLIIICACLVGCSGKPHKCFFCDRATEKQIIIFRLDGKGHGYTCQCCFDEMYLSRPHIKMSSLFGHAKSDTAVIFNVVLWSDPLMVVGTTDLPGDLEQFKDWEKLSCDTLPR